tara:strand:- start:510 stop:707 length:198 start_codon:yes stop_codon:yes gene_type:complete
MDSLYFLIPLALILTGLAIKCLFWAVNSGQYDDLDTEAHRILFDEDLIKTKPEKSASATSKPHSK